MYILVDLLMMVIFITMGSAVNDIIIDGSDVRLSYGVKYAIRSISSGRYLDGRQPNDDQMPPQLKNTDDLDGDRFVQWTIEEHPISGMCH